MSRSILIVDDDARVRKSLLGAIADEADNVEAVADAEKALETLANGQTDIVLTDVRMPGMDGLELLRALHDRHPNTSVILMTAYDDLPTVASAMREGAVDFLVKPLELQHLRDVLRRVFEDREASRSQKVDGKRRLHEQDPDQLVGRDPHMIEIYKMVGRVAASRTNVVVRGESGTGKELIARAIHRASPYAAEPFIAINCTALPSSLLESELFGHVKGSFTGATSDRRGRFGLAGKGSIFLDEIGDTSLEFQAKLLRVLQEHEYYPVGAESAERMEARVIAATHRDLESMVENGSFREDLYYRLRVVEIVVPPLRDRLSDIPQLADHLLRRIAAESGRSASTISEEAVAHLMAHTWPGNVRELENSLARAVVLAGGSIIRPEHLDTGMSTGTDAGLGTLEETEREHIARVLTSTGGQKSKAAEILGISRPRLDRLIEKHALTDLAPGRSGGESG